MATGPNADLTQLQRALHALQQARARLDALEQARREPIAVVGMGCRFPGGADDPDAFWRLLLEGRDGITEVPADRWDAQALYDPDAEAAGKLATRWGGFVDGVDQFDPAFFGISPREAQQMDPQQRLLLEVAWEALEHAGQPAERLRGSATGVFVGVHSHSADYTWLQLGALEDIGAYTSTGTAHSIFANRVSYWLDLRGPSVAVDTACSASLVAVHLAVQSLRGHECDLALAGGVNLLLTPEITAALSRLHMMAGDGRCKTFDARADGFVRGEGCGMVVLRRLSDALAGNDPILAVIAGSAVNQDGASNGLTAPSGLAQREVVRRAFADARVDPSEVGYVETHGTGTSLGDPIEVEALAEVLGGAGDAPCVLGAVKSNIGHLEGAAGIAGLIKAVLALQHATIPPNLHFQELNPHIDLADTRFEIPTLPRPWPAAADRFAGVSSFGFGGTNAHVVLRQAPPVEAASAEAAPERARLLPISAHNPGALRALAAAYAEHLAGSHSPLDDVVHTASVRRTYHEHRLAVVGRSADELRDALSAFLAGEERSGVRAGRADPETRRGLVWVFSGQGAQHPGMGVGLLDGEPVFREALEACDRLLRPLGGWSLLDELAAPAEQSRLERTEVAQPAMFALQVALAALWRSWGILPDAVLGHSVGEVAAAHVAGALSLEDAVRVIHHRGRVMQAITRPARMAAVGLSRADAAAFLVGGPEGVSLAAVNGPRSCMLAGDAAAVEAAAQELAGRGVFVRLMPMPYAFHSPHMDPAREELVGALNGLPPRPATIPIFSTVTGGPVGPAELDARYWGRNVREPVLFADAVAAAGAVGFDDFLEIGPHPLLRTPLEQCTGAGEGLILGSLQRDTEDRTALLQSLAALYSGGYPVAWPALYATGKVVSLPAYPWQRSRFWLAPSRRRPRQDREDDAFGLPGRPLRSPAIQGIVFESRLDAAAIEFLGEHRIDGERVVPAALLAEMAASAGRAALKREAVEVRDLALLHPLALPDGSARIAHSILQPPADGRSSWQLHSSDADGDGWILHATADVHHLQDEPPRIPANGAADSQATRRVAVLDACFRQALAEGAAARDPAHRYVVGTVRRLHLPALPQGELSCQIQLDDQGDGPGFVADAHIFDGSGACVGSVEGIGFARVATTAVARDDWLYEVTWRPSTAEPSAPEQLTGRYLILAGPSDLAQQLAHALGARADLVPPGEPETLEASVAAWLADGDESPSTVVWLGDGTSQPTADIDARVRADCAALLAVGRALIGADQPARLWIVTRSAQPVGGGVADPAAAALWGLGRVIALEAPAAWGGLIDLAPDGEPPGDLDAVLTQFAAADGEDQAAFRDGERFVPRLTRLGRTERAAPKIRGDAAYLITGGLGSIGLELARWLAEHGAGHIVLTGRTALPDRAAWPAEPPDSPSGRRIGTIHEIEVLGAQITTVAVDVANAEAMAALIARFGSDLPPLKGVFHAAAVMEFATITRLQPQQLEAMLRPKVRGAWLLHELTRALDLDHFVLFSSVAALWGSRGMAHYAAANQFLDGLAHHCKAQGLPALAINWGGWAGGDLARDTSRFLEQSDLRLLPPGPALDALGAAMAAGVAQRTVAWADWAAVRAGYELGSGRPFLHEIEAVDEAATAAVGAALGGPLLQLDGLDEDEALVLLTSLVQDQVAAVLKFDSAQLLEPGQGFFKLGMDSLMTVELRGRLERSVGLKLPTTIALEYPTVESLAGYLAGVLRGAPAEQAALASNGASALPDDIDGAGLDDLSDDELATMLDVAVADLLAEEATPR